MKNIILLTLGVGDFFFHKEHSKISKDYQESFVNQISEITHNPKYTGVVNVTIPADTTKTVNVFAGRRPQSVSKLTLYSDASLLHVNNELKILSVDQEELLFNGNQFDFIFPPKDYEIHVCGLDVNGVMVSSIKELLDLNYTVKLYSGSIKPHKNTYKQINRLKHPAFTFCSQKSAI